MAAFKRLSDASPELKANVDHIGGGVFSHLIDQVVALGQKRAHERVCFLLAEIRRRGVGPDRNTVELAMTRQDIADYLGLSTETVSRALCRLSNDGIIANRGHQTVNLLRPDVVMQLGRVNGN